MSENQESLANLGHEDRLFPPTAEFAAQANVDGARACAAELMCTVRTLP